MKSLTSSCSLILPLFLLSSKQPVLAINTITLTNTDYQGSEINCPQGVSCLVQCDEDESCRGSTIHCPQGKYCNVQCWGYMSCADAIINIDSDDSVSAIQCIGDSSCSDAVINGKNQSVFDVYCLESNSCQSAVIDAGISNNFELLGCTDPESCFDLSLICPPNVDGESKCIIHESAEFGGFLKLYAINGFRDLSINTTGSTVTGTLRDGVMFCGNNFTSTCNIQQSLSDEDDWRCDIEGDATCNNGIANFIIDLWQENVHCSVPNVHNLGKSFLTKMECAQSAFETEKCTTRFLQWNDDYKDSWGCYCCTSMDTIEYHSVWDIYEFYIDSGTNTQAILSNSMTTYAPKLMIIPTPEPVESLEPYIEHEKWCNESKPVTIWITFDYQIGTGGIIQSQISHIITNITANFIQSEVSILSASDTDCHIEHEDMVQNGYFSAGLCFECTDRSKVKEINAWNYNLSALAKAFERTFHRGTSRLMLWNQSTEIEITTNSMTRNSTDTSDNEESKGGIWGDLGSSTVSLLVLMMLCAFLILMVILIYVSRRQYRVKRAVAEAELAEHGQKEGDGVGDSGNGNKAKVVNEGSNSRQSPRSERSERSEEKEIEISLDSDFDVLDMDGLRDTDRGPPPILDDAESTMTTPPLPVLTEAESTMSMIIGGTTDGAFAIPRITETNSGRPEGASRMMTGGNHGDV